MKKFIACLALVILSSNLVYAQDIESTYTQGIASVGLANASENDDICIRQIDPRTISSLPDIGEPNFEDQDERSVSAATINVNVTSPCDAEFRKANTNWMNEANRAVERADDELYTRYGIDFYSVSQPVWTSSGSDSSAVLANAISQHGLTYDSSKKAQLMIAFSKKAISDTDTAGIARTSNAYCVVFDNGYTINAETAQHEGGHTYGLSHCTNDCVMTASGFGYIGKICTSHNTTWSNNKNLY